HRRFHGEDRGPARSLRPRLSRPRSCAARDLPRGSRAPQSQLPRRRHQRRNRRSLSGFFPADAEVESLRDSGEGLVSLLRLDAARRGSPWDVRFPRRPPRAPPRILLVYEIFVPVFGRSASTLVEMAELAKKASGHRIVSSLILVGSLIGQIA